MTRLSPSIPTAPVRCLAVHDESADVRSFTLAPTQATHWPHRAGQFITLEVPHAQGMLKRCYTIASAPHQRPDGAFTLTIKRKPGGLVSNWLHEHLQPGVELIAHAPAGVFCLDRSRPLRLALVAGGVGITPLLSMTRELAACGLAMDIDFIQCTRTPDAILFHAELLALAQQAPGLRLHFLPAQIASDASWPGPSGQITPALLAAFCPDLAQRDLYCCGPAGFMTEIRRLYLEAGGSPTHYHEEAFALADPGLPAPADPHARADPQHLVSLRQSGQQTLAAASATLLHTLRAAGLNLPSACEMGLCGTCKVKVLAGEVELSHQGGIDDQEISDGWTLACCSRPCGPLTLDL